MITLNGRGQEIFYNSRFRGWLYNMITWAVAKFRISPKSPQNWLSFNNWKLFLNVVVPSQNSLTEPTGKSQSNIGYPRSSMKYLRYIASQMTHHFKLSYMEVNKNPVHVNLRKPTPSSPSGNG